MFLSIHQFYLQNAFHHRYLFSTSFKLEKLFDATSFGSKNCFTIEISFESVASNYKLAARSFCLCERSFDRHKLNTLILGTYLSLLCVWKYVDVTLQSTAVV